jgi:hypothetical protein
MPDSVAYFDTNIIGELVACPGCWDQVERFLLSNNLVLGISEATLLELSDAKRSHTRLAEFLHAVPSGLLKLADTVLAEEVQAYPNARSETLFHGHVLRSPSDKGTVSILEALFQRKEILEARDKQLQDEPVFVQRASGIRKQCQEHGWSTVDDAWRYAVPIVLQYLAKNHRQFFLQFRGRELELRPEAFKSMWLFVLVQYYQYCIHKKKPQYTDFGDFHHVFPIPYCKIVVVEKLLCQVLRHIKLHDEVLVGVEIENIDFIRNLTGVPFQL